MSDPNPAEELAPLELAEWEVRGVGYEGVEGLCGIIAFTGELFQDGVSALADQAGGFNANGAVD